MSFYTKVIDLQKLNQAWDHVRKNKPSGGVDGVTCEAFEANRKEELQQLHLELAEHRYQSLPVRMVTLYQGEKEREIALFSMRDKIVHQSFAAELSKQYDVSFSPSVYAYRPGRSALDAVNKIHQEIRQDFWVLKADIHHFFDTIDCGKLLKYLSINIKEEDTIELLKSILSAKQLQKDGTLEGRERGIFQGSSVAPVLSNIYLNAFDKWMEKQTDIYIRYSDDILVLGKDKDGLETLLSQMNLYLERLGLKLNQEKTGISPVSQGFSFLGYTFGPEGKQVPKKAEENLSQRLETVWLTCGGLSAEEKLKKCSEIITGWEQYYRGERKPGSILEYGVLLYMTRYRERKVFKSIARMRPDYENEYADLLDFLVKEWKRLEMPWYGLFEYEQYYQVPEAEKCLEMSLQQWNQNSLYGELMEAYETFAVLQQEEGCGELIQIYSDLGYYGKAVCFQEKMHQFHKKSMPKKPEAVHMEDVAGTEYAFTNQEIQNYMSLFVGREDLYGQEAIGYNNKRTMEQILEPMTEEVIVSHIKGEITAGTYVQRSNHTAHFLVLDIDISKKILLLHQENKPVLEQYMEMAAKHTGYLLKILGQLGLKGYAEYSGRRGYHIWVFFSEWMPVRYLHMLEDVIEEQYRIQEREEIQLEFFPDKSRMRSGSAGQCIKLPLGIHSRTGKRSVLLEEDFSVVQDPGVFLKDAAVFSLKAIRKILSVHQPEEKTIGSPIGVRPEVDTDISGFGALPDTVRVVLQNCSLVRYLCQKARTTGYLGHFERLSILYVFGHLGDDGKEFVHQVMQFTLNYQYNTTERFIRKIPEKPISCIKLRDQYKTITAEYGCSCTFKRTKNCYPSPVLHAIRGADADAGEVTIPTSRTLTKEKEKVVYEEINIHKKVQETASRILELKKQKRGIDKSIEKLEKEMESIFDNAGIDCLEIEMGLLLRRKTEQGYEWIIQI